MDDYSWDLRVQSAVGIDLGTTCSCVAVYRQGRVSLAPDENGHKLVPSVVAIRNNRGRVQKIVGNAALEHNVVENIITESKRLLGRNIDDPNVQSLRERSTFEIVESRTGNAEISLQLDGKRHRFSPEDISSAILAKLKLMAEKHIGGDTEVNAAVITVPAYFNNVQREATKRAAMDVGLDVLAIVNEPSAAAIAYGLRSRVREARKILVVDIGGGTSDVSLVQVIEEKFDVLSSKGDNNLGGEDFDTNLVTYCVQLIIQQHGVDIRKHNEAMKRLRDQCKLVKHKLSENPADPHWHYLLEIDDLVTNVDISLPISRKQFEKLNENLFQKIIQLITDCLITAKLKHEDIDEVVPVGGSMRTPKLRELVQNEFNGKRLYSYINPDEAIAVGASIFAAQITGNYNGHFMLSEITPLSLGVRVKLNKEMSIVIPRNSKLPCKVTKRYQTLKENQKAAKIAIYQGENVLVKDNALLGEIEMTGLEGDLPSQNIMHVTFEISTDGLFKVRVEELSTRREVEREFESLIPSLAVFNVGDKANGAKK